MTSQSTKLKFVLFNSGHKARGGPAAKLEPAELVIVLLTPGVLFKNGVYDFLGVLVH